MDLSLDSGLLVGYSSGRQQARLVTEMWASSNFYCPNCLEPQVSPEKVGSPLVDFRCSNPSCGQTFQLKSQKSKFGRVLRDAAYRPWINSMKLGTTPNLTLLQYDVRRLRVVNVEVIPSFFLRPSCFESWLLSTREHYEMCSIHLNMIGPDARIKIVQGGEIMDQTQVQAQFKSFAWMRHASWRNRGWTADVLRCIRDTGKTQFTLHDVYAYESTLQKLHPENKFVRPKIRQQLQVLRDRGFLTFTRPGCYEIA